MLFCIKAIIAPSKINLLKKIKIRQEIISYFFVILPNISE